MNMPVQRVSAPLVEFVTEAEEDRNATIAAGAPVFKDVIYALVTPHGSYSQFKGVASEWIERQSREPYYDTLKRMLAAYKEGQEPPLEGTAIENCPSFTPADVKQIRAGGVRTVEDLATYPDGAGERIGMGFVRLKQKAGAWLEAAQSTGAAAEKIAAQAVEIENLKATNSNLQDQLAGLAQRMAALEGPRQKLGLKRDDAA